jgi:hypothetical protein
MWTQVDTETERLRDALRDLLINIGFINVDTGGHGDGETL